MTYKRFQIIRDMHLKDIKIALESFEINKDCTIDGVQGALLGHLDILQDRIAKLKAHLSENWIFSYSCYNCEKPLSIEEVIEGQEMLAYRMLDPDFEGWVDVTTENPSELVREGDRKLQREFLRREITFKPGSILVCTECVEKAS